MYALTGKVTFFASRTKINQTLEALTSFTEDMVTQGEKVTSRVIKMGIELAEEFEGQLKIVKINADEEADVLAKYAVRGLPTMMVFKDGQSVDVTVGAQPYPAIKAMLQKHL